MIKYYDLKDVKKIGKSVSGDDLKHAVWPDLIYEDGRWQEDSDMLIMQRLLGVDETEPEDSPYRIGNTEMLNAIEEISEEEAANLILRYY